MKTRNLICAAVLLVLSLVVYLVAFMPLGNGYRVWLGEPHGSLNPRDPHWAFDHGWGVNNFTPDLWNRAVGEELVYLGESYSLIRELWDEVRIDTGLAAVVHRPIFLLRPNGEVYQRAIVTEAEDGGRWIRMDSVPPKVKRVILEGRHEASLWREAAPLYARTEFAKFE